MSTFTITNTTDAHITISFAPPAGAPVDLPSPFGTVEVAEVKPKIGRPFGSLPDYSFVNAARRWSPNEDRLLLALVAKGRKPNQIAKVIGRSPKAVTLRINGLKSKSQ